MKASELREQSVEELRERLEDLEEESFNLRFQHTLGQLSSPIRLRDVRRDIARVRTVLHESATGLRVLPGAGARTEGANAQATGADDAQATGVDAQTT